MPKNIVIWIFRIISGSLYYNQMLLFELLTHLKEYSHQTILLQFYEVYQNGNTYQILCWLWSCRTPNIPKLCGIQAEFNKRNLCWPKTFSNMQYESFFGMVSADIFQILVKICRKKSISMVLATTQIVNRRCLCRAKHWFCRYFRPTDVVVRPAHGSCSMSSRPLWKRLNPSKTSPHDKYTSSYFF